MSHVLILSSDKKMPDFYGVEGFHIEKSYHKQNIYVDLDRFIKKEYYNEIYIYTNNFALWKLKEYLLKNMKTDSEIELWSLWLGGDFTKHYPSMPKISNIPDVCLNDVEDSIDFYTENHFSPVIKKVSLCELSINDISFLNTQSGSCLIISNTN